MKKIFYLLIAFICTISLAQAKTSTIKLNYILTAKSAELKNIPGKSGHYTLILRGVNPYIDYYSDRPNRIINNIPLITFLKNWKNKHVNYVANPPNALLTGALLDETTNLNSTYYTMILSHPRLNKKSYMVVFDARPISHQAFTFKHFKYRHAILMID